MVSGQSRRPGHFRVGQSAPIFGRKVFVFESDYNVISSRTAALLDLSLAAQPGRTLLPRSAYVLETQR